MKRLCNLFVQMLYNLINFFLSNFTTVKLSYLTLQNNFNLTFYKDSRWFVKIIFVLYRSVFQ